MKKSTIRIPCWFPRALSVGGLSFVLAGFPSLGADDAPASSSASVSAPGAATKAPYTIEIVNGTLLQDGKKEKATLGAVADVLRELFQDANLVLEPDLKEVPVDDLKLRAPELPDALEALRVATEFAFTWRKGGVADNTVDPNTGLPVPSRESNLYILTREQAPRPSGARRLVEVYNLSGYLRQDKRDDRESRDAVDRIQSIILSSLEQVRGLGGPANQQPQFMFHPGASLLVVTGPPDAIEVASKILMALPGVTGPQPRETPGAVKPGSMGAQTLSPEEMERFRRRYGIRYTPPTAATAPAQPVAPRSPNAPALPADPTVPKR